MNQNLIDSILILKKRELKDFRTIQKDFPQNVQAEMIEGRFEYSLNTGICSKTLNPVKNQLLELNRRYREENINLNVIEKELINLKKTFLKEIYGKSNCNKELLQRTIIEIETFEKKLSYAIKKGLL